MKRENDLTLGGVLAFHPAVFKHVSHDKKAEVKNTSASGEDFAPPGQIGLLPKSRSWPKQILVNNTTIW